MNYLEHTIYRVFKARKSGCKFRKAKTTDFKVGLFFGLFKDKKETTQEIKMLSVKNQGRRNTCTFEGNTVAKEVDENKVLSVRSIVGWAKKMGLIKGNGFADIETAEKAMSLWGILEQGVIPEYWNGNFKKWSSLDIERFKTEAGKHKTSSYWFVENTSELYQLLKKGRPVKVAMRWYTGFNTGGGFSSPWIIEKAKGVSVGYHLFVVKQYIKGYKGKNVYKCQNSYGEFWGDGGDFYIEERYIAKALSIIHGTVNLDIEVNLGKLLKKYIFKNIKVKNNSTIYFVQNGKKRPYPNMATFAAFNGLYKGFIEVSQEDINAIPIGDMMDIEKSLYWPYIKNLKDEPAILNELIKIISNKQ